MAKWVYMFTEGNADMRNLLGGKGANLAEMTNLGLPVPQGFTVTTEACTQYYEDGRQINDEIMGQIMEAIDKMEGITGKKFGDAKNPLLVSVRSGARASMPGMMVICVKIYVLFYAFLLFHLVDQLFEVFFTNFHNYVREHLNESSVAVPSPTWVAGSL